MEVIPIKIFKFKELKLKGAFLVEPFVFNDNRGDFIKDYSNIEFKSISKSFDIKETFYANSKKNVVRGLHFQLHKPQAKMVRCIKGSIYDVIVDIRKDSETFGHWIGSYLNDENNLMLLIPAGFAHGYLALSDALVSYKCDENFYSDGDSGIKWNDTYLKIDWPTENLADIIISMKDSNLMTFAKYKELNIDSTSKKTKI